MSTISRDDVLKLAQLARLQLTDDEVDKYQKELSSILGYVETLSSADTDGLEPTYQVTGLHTVVRADDIIDYKADSLSLMKNAPAIEKGQFKVKRMIG